MKSTASSDRSEAQSSCATVPKASALPISCIKKPRPNISYQSSEVLEMADLLRAILVKLPPKTLFRLTTVSKHWNEIITDQKLICSLKVPRNPTAVFVRRLVLHNDDVKFTHIPLEGVTGGGGSKVKCTSVSLNLFEDKKLADIPFLIKHSGNGLMICSASDRGSYFLYNPNTKTHVRIPELKSSVVKSMHIAFQGPGTYKIFAVFLSEITDRLHLQALEPTQRLLHWKNMWVNFPALGSEVVNYGYGVYMDGVIYWPCYRSSGLLFFNVREETLQWLPEVPHPYNNFSGIAYFGECKGNLCMVVDDSMRGAVFDMLELKTDRSMWFIKYRIDLTPRATRARTTLPILVLALLPGEEEDEDSYLIVHILGEVVSYNLKDGTMRKLCNLGLWTAESNFLRSEPWNYVHPYKQNPVYPSLNASLPPRRVICSPGVELEFWQQLTDFSLEAMKVLLGLSMLNPSSSFITFQEGSTNG